MKQFSPDVLAKYSRFLKKNPQFNRKRLQQKYIATINIVLSLVAVSFFGLFAINPTVSTIFNLQKQYADSKLVDEALSHKLQALRILTDQHAQLQPKLAIIDAGVPNQSDIPKLTRQIETLAYGRNIDIERLEFGPIELFPANKTNPPIYSFTFSLTLIGDSADLQNFIYDLISFERIISLEKVTTGNVRDGSGGSFIVGRAYFQTAL